ncbi:MAG: NADH-quinone oxidoreductase subunit L [Anaerolineales bacterium]
MDQNTLFAWLIPAPPLAAFFLIVLLVNRSKWLSHTVAIAAIGISLVLSWTIVFRAVFGGLQLGEQPLASSVPWLPTGDTALNMGVAVDPLTVVMLFFVPLACFLIILYSVGYSNYGKARDDHDVPGSPPHNGVEPLYSRFFAFLSLFAGAMLVLTVADNLLLLFIGWEIMGLCSYLLIGFWYGRNYADPNQTTPRQAAVKAFMTTRVADVVMLLGIVYLFSLTGTLNFRDIFFNEGTMDLLVNTPAVLAVGGLAASHLIGLLLFAGTVGKSAQFPLHVWLPDAMEGPTPVSAMIHAAAMVSAGVYMVVRIFPLLSAGAEHGGNPALSTMAAVGAFTALFAATIAVAQNDVKRVLAYSTISQLGYMVAALGIGAYIAAAFHLMTHAFFKALLFMGSGSIIHGVEHGQHHSHEELDPQDMLNMGGLRRRMPVTFWTFLIGGFSLAGFPFITAGFWSKDEILADAFANGHGVVFIVLLLAAFLTAFYTMRQIVLTFLGEARTESAAHAHESTWTMTLPLVVLSFFAIFAGFVGVHPQFPGLGALLGSSPLERFLIESLPHHIEGFAFDWTPVLLSVVAGLGGLGLGWLVYGWKPLARGQPDPLVSALGPVHSMLQNKYYVDELYRFLFVRPAQWISATFTFRWVDRGLIDGILHAIALVAFNIGTWARKFDIWGINYPPDRLGDGVKVVGRSFRALQTGRIQNYLLVSVAAVLALGGVFYYYLFLTP